jgi:hypothetical protein
MKSSKTLLDATKPGVLVIGGQTYRPSIFQVGGRELELYTLGVLAKALGKIGNTVREWEYSGLIPKPIFRVSGSPRTESRRWYSRQQIVNLHQVKNRFPFSAGRPYLKGLFFAAFNRVFDEGEIIDVGQLQITDPGTSESQQPESVGDSGRHQAGPQNNGHAEPGQTSSSVQKRVTTQRQAIPEGIARQRRDTITTGRTPVRPAASSPQPQGNREMVTEDSRRPATTRSQDGGNYSRPQQDSRPPEGGSGYVGDSPSRPEDQRPSYRRRPASRV